MATLIRQGGREAADVWGAPAQVLAPRVRAGLDSAHPEPRRKALACLLRLDPSRLEEVARQLGDDSDVITALGIVGMWRPLGKQGARILLCRFEQGSPWRVGACRQAMRRLGQSALRELIQVWKDVAEEVPARSFSWAGRDALAGALAGALLTDDRANAAEVVEAIGTPALRRQIVGTWLAQGDPAADRLLALVRGGLGDRPRWWAAEALGLGAEGGRAERLRAALADEDAGDLATAVIRAHLGDAAGLDAVVRQLEHHDDDACQVCAEALARLGAPAAPAVRALKQALALSTDQETRQAVREAMDRIQRSLGAAPTELEAASAPAGSGTELEAMAAPDGSGSEPEGGAVPGQAGRAATAPARLPERPDSSGRPTR